MVLAMEAVFLSLTDTLCVSESPGLKGANLERCKKEDCSCTWRTDLCIQSAGVSQTQADKISRGHGRGRTIL